jgi:HlyD family secretion protein
MLFTIADMNHLIFKGQVSEIDITKLPINTPATLKIAALPDTTLTGMVTKIGLQSTSATKADVDASNPMTGASSSDSQSNNLPFAVGFNVEISQLNDAQKNLYLRAGYSANADIVVKQAKNVLLIPMRVLHFENEKPYVFVVDKKGKFKKQFIKIGLSDGMQAQVLEGLREGQKVVEKKPDLDSDHTTDEDNDADE